MCDCGKCRCDPGFSGPLCDTCLVNLPELIQINTYHAVFCRLLLKNEKKYLQFQLQAVEHVINKKSIPRI